MKVTVDSLNELVGFEIFDCTSFGIGNIITLDGVTWQLEEICGSELVFKELKNWNPPQGSLASYYKQSLS